VKVKSPGNSSERWTILLFTVIRKIIGAFSFLFSFFDTWYIIKYFHITFFFPNVPVNRCGLSYTVGLVSSNVARSNYLAVTERRYSGCFPSFLGSICGSARIYNRHKTFLLVHIHPRSQGLTADTALPEALAKTKTGTSKIL
jgi:hypothetical protein